MQCNGSVAPPSEWICDVTSEAADGRVSDVEERCTVWPAVQGNDFELILSAQMKSQHSVDTTGREFSSVYIVTELWGHEVGSRWGFFQKSCLFGKKTTPYGEIYKIVFRKDSPARGSTSFVQILWYLADRKSVKSRVVYLTKKTKFRLALASSPWCPKSATTSGKQCTQSAPNYIQIGSLPAELYPNAWTPFKRAIKCFHYSAKL